MDYNKAALEMHESHKGKVGIVSKVEVATRDKRPRALPTMCRCTIYIR